MTTCTPWSRQRLEDLGGRVFSMMRTGQGVDHTGRKRLGVPEHLRMIPSSMMGQRAIRWNRSRLSHAQQALKSKRKSASPPARRPSRQS